MIIPQAVVDKFHARTIKGPGCWKFRGSLMGFHFNHKRVLPHHLSYMIYKGPMTGGLWVLHKCDNPETKRPGPPCINPDHLILGTPQQNQADKFLKGRSTFGVKNPNHKLTEEEVKAIDRALNRGVHPSELAPLYGVCERTIDRIKYRENWRYLAVDRGL